MTFARAVSGIVDDAGKVCARTLRERAARCARRATGGEAGVYGTDDRYELVTEGRHREHEAWADRVELSGAPRPFGYSSCYDLVLFILWDVCGVRSPWVNREANPALTLGPYGKRWKPAESPRMLRQCPELEWPERPEVFESLEPGDIVRMGDAPTGPDAAHVAVVLDVRDGGELVTADYGQSMHRASVCGRVRTRRFERRAMRFGGKRWRELYRLDRVLKGALERGEWSEPGELEL